MRWFDKQRLNSLWVCGFLIVLLMRVLCCQAFAEDEAVMVKRIVEAHEKALKVYNAKHDRFDAMIVMRDSGVDKIIDNKPNFMKNSEYVNILNDYGFFLSISTHEDKIDLSIKIFRRVLSLCPERIPVCLNLGDVLFEKLKFVSSYTEKIDMASEIEKLYLHYRKMTHKKNDRVDRFISNNISSNDQSKTVCEYILNNEKKGIFNQILFKPLTDGKPKLCDIDLDGSKEFISVVHLSRYTQELRLKKNISDQWITTDDCPIDVVPHEFADIEGGWETIYGYIGIIPFRDGLYYIKYDGNDNNPAIFYVSKLFLDHQETACIFKTKYREVTASNCSDNELCNSISVKKNNNLKYVANKKKYNVKVDGGYLFDQMPEETSDVEFYPLIFKSNIYYDVKTPAEYDGKPFHEIWSIKNKKKIVVCEFTFTPYNVPIYSKQHN